MIIGGVKLCKKCGEEKPLDGFYVDRRSPTGVTSACKECCRASNKRWRDKHPAKQRAASDEWKRRNPDRVRIHQRNHQFGEGRDKYLAKRKRYRERHASKLALEWAAYYEENREAVLASKDPEKRRLARERYRMRLLDAFVENVPFDVILVRDQGYCGICGEPIMEPTIELDHIVPLAAGGTHEPNNVQLAHRACNRRKGAKVAA